MGKTSSDRSARSRRRDGWRAKPTLRSTFSMPDAPGRAGTAPILTFFIATAACSLPAVMQAHRALLPAGGSAGCRPFPGYNDLGLPCAFGQLRLCDEAGQSYRIGIFEVGVDRSHDDASFHRDEIDADQRNADPGVDDDTFVEYAVQ